MTKKVSRVARQAPWPAAPRMQGPTILATMGALLGAAALALCLLNDVHLAGGYDFLGRTLEAKLLSRVIGAAAVIVAYMALGTSFRRPRVLPGLLLLVSLGLAIHVPVVFSSQGPGWLIVGVLVVTSGAFVLASTRRVQDDLRRIGAADAPLQPPHHSK